MQKRRDFIKTAVSCALVAPLASSAASFVAPTLAASSVAPARAGDFVIVNGWVLTRADLALLKRDDL